MTMVDFSAFDQQKEPVLVSTEHLNGLFGHFNETWLTLGLPLALVFHVVVRQEAF